MKDFKISAEECQRMRVDEIKSFVEQIRAKLLTLKKTTRGKHVLFSAIESINCLILSTNHFDNTIISHFNDDQYIEQSRKKDLQMMNSKA